MYWLTSLPYTLTPKHTHLPLTFFVHMHYVHTLHSIIPIYAYTHARTHTGIYNTNHALTFSRVCFMNRSFHIPRTEIATGLYPEFVKIRQNLFPLGLAMSGVTTGSDTCWRFSIYSLAVHCLETVLFFAFNFVSFLGTIFNQTHLTAESISRVLYVAWFWTSY